MIYSELTNPSHRLFKNLVMPHSALLLYPFTYTPLAVVSRARKTLRVLTTASDRANSGCFVERRHCTLHAKIPN
jgi:hypothetical protein